MRGPEGAKFAVGALAGAALLFGAEQIIANGDTPVNANSNPALAQPGANTSRNSCDHIVLGNVAFRNYAPGNFLPAYQAGGVQDQNGAFDYTKSLFKAPLAGDAEAASEAIMDATVAVPATSNGINTSYSYRNQFHDDYNRLTSTDSTVAAKAAKVICQRTFDVMAVTTSYNPVAIAAGGKFTRFTAVNGKDSITDVRLSTIVTDHNIGGVTYRIYGDNQAKASKYHSISEVVVEQNGAIDVAGYTTAPDTRGNKNSRTGTSGKTRAKGPSGKNEIAQNVVSPKTLQKISSGGGSGATSNTGSSGAHPNGGGGVRPNHLSGNSNQTGTQPSGTFIGNMVGHAPAGGGTGQRAPAVKPGKTQEQQSGPLTGTQTGPSGPGNVGAHQAPGQTPQGGGNTSGNTTGIPTFTTTGGNTTTGSTTGGNTTGTTTGGNTTGSTTGGNTTGNTTGTTTGGNTTGSTTGSTTGTTTGGPNKPPAPCDPNAGEVC